jgi:hypothetical protein
MRRGGQAPFCQVQGWRALPVLRRRRRLPRQVSRLDFFLNWQWIVIDSPPINCYSSGHQVIGIDWLFSAAVVMKTFPSLPRGNGNSPG